MSGDILDDLFSSDEEGEHYVLILVLVEVVGQNSSGHACGKFL